MFDPRLRWRLDFVFYGGFGLDVNFELCKQAGSCVKLAESCVKLVESTAYQFLQWSPAESCFENIHLLSYRPTNEDSTACESPGLQNLC